MLITLEEVVQIFAAEGFRLSHSTRKVNEYVSIATGSIVYLRKEVGLPQWLAVVLAPDASTAYANSISGATRSENYLHSSNMRKFPKRRHTGENDIHYGQQFRLSSLTALREFLNAMGLKYKNIHS